MIKYINNNMIQLRINPDHISKFNSEEPDRVTHFVRTGYKDNAGNSEWFVFVEDAYELEPHQSGVKRLSVETIEKEYGVNIPEELAKRQEKITRLIGGVDRTDEIDLNTKE